MTRPRLLAHLQEIRGCRTPRTIRVRRLEDARDIQSGILIAIFNKSNAHFHTISLLLLSLFSCSN